MEETLFDKLCASLEYHADDWEVDDREYTITHTKTSLELWISGGVRFLKVHEPVKVDCFSFWQKFRLMRIIEKTLREKEVGKFKKNMKLVTKLIDAL